MEDVPLTTNTKPHGYSSKMENSHPDPFVVEARSEHTHTAILLHGLGSRGETFGVEFLKSGISSAGTGLSHSLPGTKFVFPTASRRRSAAFRRALIPQWFNLASLEDPMGRAHLQVDGLGESAQYLRSILRREMEIVPP